MENNCVQYKNTLKKPPKDLRVFQANYKITLHFIWLTQVSTSTTKKQTKKQESCTFPIYNQSKCYCTIFSKKGENLLMFCLFLFMYLYVFIGQGAVKKQVRRSFISVCARDNQNKQNNNL